MQKRFAQENFSKKKSMHSNEHSEKVPKSISEELISKKKKNAVAGTFTLTLPSVMVRLQRKGMQK